MIKLLSKAATVNDVWQRIDQTITFKDGLGQAVNTDNLDRDYNRD